MRREILEIPEAVQRLLDGGWDGIEAIGRQLRERDPRVVATVARGSSDHAASYLKYAIELSLGLPVASIGPSIASIYGRTLRLDDALAISISQSGKSPDIVAMARSAGAGGAMTVAVTNTVPSDLAEVCDHTIALRAGDETSVAATKTFVSSIVAGLALIAAWNEDAELGAAIRNLPEKLAQAARCDWSDLREAMRKADSIFVLGRGPGFAIANEAALKFKETCGIQGESYSAAEVMHGPVSIVTPGYPVLALAARDAALTSVTTMAGSLAEKGASAFVTAEPSGGVRGLPYVATGHPLTDPLALIVSFYAFVEELARSRGLNPDEPRLLKKVTETV
jgi:glucosamine--fructose-6-phosphate aminotransferase (isomerizing)